MSDDLEERKRKATEEWRELIKWELAEEDKVTEQLRREGAVMGLDANHERYAYIRETRLRRMMEIAEKYGLPHKLKA